MPSPDAFPSVLADRYRIEREIGHGGMATVFLAEDLKHGRRVALKVLGRDLAEAIGPERFVREIQIAARLNHPHIVPLFDSGALDGTLFYAMPFIAGESLRARLRREGRLPADEAARIAIAVLGALGYAHAQGLVHRDIKPENILISEGIALVADFGLAALPLAGAGARTALGDRVETGLTLLGVAVGTPHYMSPEQISTAGPLDGRSDLYSLACTLYEVLAGAPPFGGETVEEVLKAHLEGEPAPLESRCPGLPPALVAAIARGMARDREQRFGSALAFAEALRHAAGSAAVATDAPSGTVALPRPGTNFIGREQELAACRDLLTRARLVTLTGIGGSGKTRLALRTAEDVAGGFPGGAWFVDLSPVTDPAHVAAAAGAAIGLSEQPGRPMLERVIEHLAPRRALLVLDNCEDVILAAAALAEAVLAGAPAVRVLATSREPLRLPGEALHAVPPMSLPPAGDAARASQILSSESVRLFLDRAKLAGASMEPDASTAAVLADICRGLDGMPLAIELAAARARVLDPEQIRARLAERFRLLRATGGGLPERHQTLRATLQWSCDQLEPADRERLEALSVFAGGCPLEAAVRVARGEGDEFEVLDSLARLAERALVVVDREHGHEPRYRLLETIRAFAGERLADSAQRVAVREAHLAWCVDVAERGDAQLRSGDPAEALRTLDLEHENLRAAQQWCTERPAADDLGLRLASARWRYWEVRGLAEEGLRDLAAALARADAGGSSVAIARALQASAFMAKAAHALARSREFTERALAMRLTLGDTAGSADSTAFLAVLDSLAGDYNASRAGYERALAMIRDLDDPNLEARVSNNLATLEEKTGRYERAEQLLLRAVELNRGLGVRALLVGNFFNLGVIAGHRGDYAGARVRYGECVRIARELGFKRWEAGGLNGLGNVANWLGDLEGASEHYQAALALSRESGDLDGVGVQATNLAEVEMLRGETGRAREFLLQGLAIFHAAAKPDQVAQGFEVLAWIESRAGRPEAAARLLGAAEAQRSVIGAPIAPELRDRQAEAIERVTRELGPERFAALRAEGAALPVAEMVSLAGRL